MELLDGRKVKASILKDLKKEIGALKAKNINPFLFVILVGDNEASKVYVKMKEKACKEIGVFYKQLNFSAEEITTGKLIDKINELNEDPKVTGILVQVPLPKHVYTPEVMRAIDPKKDVDGFTAYNLGKVFLDKEFEHLPPCTAAGIIRLLDCYNIDVKGKDVTVIGASNIVGKPVSIMLLNRKATVTVCHSKTRDLKSHTKGADILVVAVGKAKFITEDMVKDGAIIVDVGINRMQDGTLCGDVDFESVSKKSSFITPVPGGIGPMTVACLMGNIVKAAKRQNNIS